MKTRQNFLDTIDIATPCDASWEGMHGDDRTRFCALCRLNVYNLSGMSRDEAQALILEKEGRLCVRFLRRADGTVLTHDCPVGLAKIRMRLSNGLVRCAAILCFVFSSLTACGSKSRSDGGKKPVQPVIQNPQALMGEVCLPTDCEGAEVMLGKMAAPAQAVVQGSAGK